MCVVKAGGKMPMHPSSLNVIQGSLPGYEQVNEFICVVCAFQKSHNKKHENGKGECWRTLKCQLSEISRTENVMTKSKEAKKLEQNQRWVSA